jgi:hypothetical protein
MKAGQMSTGAGQDVLVVGDWYVDAHWVVAPHESQTASRKGEMHSLAVHSVRATVRALCGAGQVANILSTGNRSGQYGQVYGLGSWARDDDDFVEALLDGHNRGDNPLKLRPSIRLATIAGPPSAPQARRVFNLSQHSPDAGTNRVIRIYRKSSPEHYRLAERIDFETPLPEPSFDVVQRLPESIGYVLVKDHGHGVVTRELIQAVAARLRHATWYVATKRWDVLAPDPAATADQAHRHWLSALKGYNVRLILFQQEAVAKASTSDALFPEVGSWLVEERIPTRASLEALDRVFKLFMHDRSDGGAPVIVALPSREALIARVPQPEVRDQRVHGYVYLGPQERPHESFVPRASALFASLFCSDRLASSRDWIPTIQRALKFTAIWVTEEAGRIVDRDWIRNASSLNCTDRDALVSFDSDRSPGPPGRISSAGPRKESEFDWEHVKSEYDQAFTAWPLTPDNHGFGIVRRGDGHVLELWRAKSEVPGVISIVRAKRHMLRLLSRELDEFVRNGRPRKSFVIVDDPGGGKSMLVHKLAQSKRMRFLQVNITELTRRLDLIAFFDTIVTTQAQDRETPLLIFVDEFNALLENQPVYSSFLAPLEDGHYNRDGKSFTIDPCVWVFAGTDDLLANDARSTDPNGERSLLLELQRFVGGKSPVPRRRVRQGRAPEEARRLVDRAQKKSDFVSRLTLPPFVLNQPFGFREPEKVLEPRLVEEATRCGRAIAEPVTLNEITAALRGEPANDLPILLARRLLGDRLLRPGRALERIYVGAELMMRLHPSVESVSLRVLKAFALLPDAFTFRDLRHDLERIANVTRGQIFWDNLPTGFHQHRGECRVDSNGIVTPLEGRQEGTLSELTKREDDRVMVSVHRSLPVGDTRWAGLGLPDEGQVQVAV